VIEIAEELVKTMNGREEFVAVAQMVLTKLAGNIAERLEQFCDGGIFFLESLGCSRHADLGIAGAHRNLAGDECSTAGGATLLTVIIGKVQAFVGNTINVRCLVAHHPMVDVARVPVADVISPDDQDVGFVCCLNGRGCKA